LGQHRPVRVVNFVAQGTIEHGMLSVLSFKQSLFAGVLDGGMNEVFLGGTRLKRFMDSVDKVTQSIPTAMPPEEKVESEPDKVAEETMAAPAASAGPDWGNLISAGLTLLTKLSSTVSGGVKTPTGAGAGLRIETDESTGQRHVKLPVPSKDVLRDIAGFLSQLAEKL
jgi:hypothetical protein